MKLIFKTEKRGILMRVHSHCICIFTHIYTQNAENLISIYSSFYSSSSFVSLDFGVSRLPRGRSPRSRVASSLLSKGGILESSILRICHVEANMLFAYQNPADCVHMKRCNYSGATDARANECNCRDDGA